MNTTLKLTIVIKVEICKGTVNLVEGNLRHGFILWMRILYSSLNMKYSKRRLNVNIEDKISVMLKD